MLGRARWLSVVLFLGTTGTAPVRRCRADGPLAVDAGQRLARETRGLSAGLGLGTDYGGCGLQLRYDFPLRPWLQVAPFVGAGWLPTTWGSALATGAAGVGIGLGHRHRLTITLAVAPIIEEPLDLHGTVVDGRAVYGPGALLGYEHITDSGFFQRIGLGYGFPLWGRADSYAAGTLLVTFGAGIRLW